MVELLRHDLYPSGCCCGVLQAHRLGKDYGAVSLKLQSKYLEVIVYRRPSELLKSVYLFIKASERPRSKCCLRFLCWVISGHNWNGCSYPLALVCSVGAKEKIAVMNRRVKFQAVWLNLFWGRSLRMEVTFINLP